MISYSTPYSLDKDLGKAYNKEMDKLNDDDWMVFTDGDTAWLRPDYGLQISEILKQNTEAGMFTCLTNRIGNPDQLYLRQLSNASCILKHKRIADKVFNEKKYQIKEIFGNISGHCMIIKKSTWQQAGKFPEGVGILSVDNIFGKRIQDLGKKIFLMEGVYLFHFYRLNTNIHNTTHLR